MTTPLRTLQIGLEWFPEHGGGLDRYFHDLMRHADSVGIKVQGLVAGRASVEDESSGLVTSFTDRTAALPRRLAAARRAVRHALRERHTDLVASHFALHAFPALDQINVPLVIHFHGPWAVESMAQGQGSAATMVKQLIERSVYRHSTRCIVLSNAFKRLLVEQYGIDPDRIDISPGGIDTDRFAAVATMPRSQAREALGWPVDRPIVLAVRRLVRRMGLDHLIAAVAHVVARHPDLLLVVAGRGPEQAALQAQVDALELNDNVRLIGFVPDDDLPLAYRAADLTVTPTVALEGFGLITVEAMAAGTPAMVTPVGGLPEIVQPLAPDLVVSGPGTGPLAEGLTGWLDGRIIVPDEVACRRHAETHFSWPVSLQRIRTTYERATR
ncbi:glycosyltransferase family 4 protein [uncultured Sphingomonas sp.]|uniref:glycosyltransferase family 4 protein n=1 Tax=uncultured Sphingomonas sp. TaxID=158754 RepID=UPI0025FC52F0|nr:glycosyltransferase family 4 protein [uncultured Sphingomonas sp.]